MDRYKFIYEIYVVIRSRFRNGSLHIKIRGRENYGHPYLYVTRRKDNSFSLFSVYTSKVVDFIAPRWLFYIIPFKFLWVNCAYTPKIHYETGYWKEANVLAVWKYSRKFINACVNINKFVVLSLMLLYISGREDNWSLQ